MSTAQALMFMNHHGITWENKAEQHCARMIIMLEGTVTDCIQ